MMIRQDRAARSGNVVPAGHVQLVHPHTGPGGARQTVVAQVKKPQIKLIKDGDIVRAIEVTCACGEVIRLANFITSRYSRDPAKSDRSP